MVANLRFFGHMSGVEAMYTDVTGLAVLGVFFRPKAHGFFFGSQGPGSIRSWSSRFFAFSKQRKIPRTVAERKDWSLGEIVYIIIYLTLKHSKPRMVVYPPPSGTSS